MRLLLTLAQDVELRSGCRAPSREILRARSRESLTAVPLTAVMTSPASMPALAAGLSACGLVDDGARGLLQPETVGDVRGDGLDLHADPAARHRSLCP